MPTHNLPFALSILEPCHEDWEAMREGGESRRFCEHCKTAVVDVALLTEPELRKLVRTTGGDFCARLTRRGDGMLLLRETPPSFVPLWSLLRAPLLLAGALLGTQPQVAAAQETTRGMLQGQQPKEAPVLSCAEVTALLEEPGGKQSAAAPVAASSPAPLPSPAPLSWPTPLPAAAPVGPGSSPVGSPAPTPADERATRLAEGYRMGRVRLPATPFRLSIRLPQGRDVHTGFLEVQNVRGKSQQFPMGVNGRFEAALEPGTYRLRVDARAEDGGLYVGVDEIEVKREPLTRDLTLEGPMSVTAGAPAITPTPKRVR